MHGNQILKRDIVSAEKGVRREATRNLRNLGNFRKLLGYDEKFPRKCLEVLILVI